MSDHLLDERQLREGAAHAEELRQRFAAVYEIQRAERHTARATQVDVTATVDGTGHVLDLRIEDRVLRRGHPGLVGPAITEAVGAARLLAAQRAKELIVGGGR
ncbi:YbaB/EbfC family nucleoid-associated protein [Actinophytocola sp.]|uniref:YbaB/EbfC family nucleoid-associated protein n=1 Tax=Actinophytocola sp. TaxID=1872138 RepID=UPI00389AEAA8